MLTKAVLRELERVVGARHVSVEPEDLVCYSYDGTHVSGFRPDVVVEPLTTAEVSEVLHLAVREGIPVVPRGGGTGVSGGALPVEGGILLAMHRMNRLLEVDEKNLLARVQPGVIAARFQREVEARGLFYPPDPSSVEMCTMGGTVAENAGGARGFKYGVTRDYVLGLEVVTATGEVIRTGGKTIKNVSGYDLTSLMVGSEGTLGIVTEITTKLIPRPESRKTMLAVYDSLADASETVAGIISEKLVPATLELMDDVAMRLIENYVSAGLPLDAAAVLLIEVDGFEGQVEHEAELVRKTCYRYGAREVRVARDIEEAANLWKGRRSIMGAMAAAARTLVSEDATVPRSELPKFVEAVKRISAKHEIVIPVFGHAGDGNLHPCLLVDEADPAIMARVEPCIADMFQAALSMGGTLSGEHGIGLIKRDYMIWQHGKEGLAVMQAIKKALDPMGILNPGKVLPKVHGDAQLG